MTVTKVKRLVLSVARTKTIQLKQYEPEKVHVSIEEEFNQELSVDLVEGVLKAMQGVVDKQIDTEIEKIKEELKPQITR